jgi:alpha-beta hydrolase superfamily lysophospholipase
VMTCEVILNAASPNSRARPKSAILSSPVLAMSRLLGLRSWSQLGIKFTADGVKGLGGKEGR